MLLVTAGKLLEITITLVDIGEPILVEVGTSLELDIMLVVIEKLSELITAPVDMRIMLKETIALVDMEMLLMFEFVIPMYKEHKDTHVTITITNTLISYILSSHVTSLALQLPSLRQVLLSLPFSS